MMDGAQCIIDVLKMKCYKFKPEGGKPEKLEIPEKDLSKEGLNIVASSSHMSEETKTYINTYRRYHLW